MGFEIFENLELMQALANAQAGDPDVITDADHPESRVERIEDDGTPLREYVETLGKGRNKSSVGEESGRTPTYKEKYAAHKNPVSLHRAISVIIYDKNGRMLLQRRSKTKPTWPLFWTNACCTHPLPDESYKDAAERRLKEEMGFTVPLKDKFSFIYKAKYDEEWGEHELDHVFVGEYSGKVNPDPNEAEEYRWVEIKDLLEDIQKNPENYTPWFKIILEKLNS